LLRREKRSPMEELTDALVLENASKVGQRLSAGEVQLELGTVCEPGEWMEENRAGLMEELCRVLRGGTVSQGDPMVTGSPVRSDWASA
jgi:MOSC domain-containing protein YiiM